MVRLAIALEHKAGTLLEILAKSASVVVKTGVAKNVPLCERCVNYHCTLIGLCVYYYEKIWVQTRPIFFFTLAAAEIDRYSNIISLLGVSVSAVRATFKTK